MNERLHRILEETISIKSFGAGGITVDLPVPPFKSPDSWFSPVYIGTSRMLLKDRVKLEKGKKQNPWFRVGLFEGFLAWEEMRQTKVEEARSEAMQRNWKGNSFPLVLTLQEGGDSSWNFEMYEQILILAYTHKQALQVTAMALLGQEAKWVQKEIVRYMDYWA